jgi:ATP-dependent Clp protease protease subunit
MSEHFLMLAAQINQQSQSALIGYLTDLAINGATKLTIAISSPGGNVVSGVTMYNSLISMPYEIVTHNIGNVDSIAVVIFLAGARRLANPASTFMFHGAGFDGNANERLEESNLRAKLDTLIANHKTISEIISTRTSLNLADCMKLFEKQETKDTGWASSLGLINDIKEFRLPVGSNVKHLL